MLSVGIHGDRILVFVRRRPGERGPERGALTFPFLMTYAAAVVFVRNIPRFIGRTIVDHHNRDLARN